MVKGLLASAFGLALASVFVIGCASTKHIEWYHPTELSWIALEGGTFKMGDSFLMENPDAIPVHTVLIQPFYISRFETTYEQYDAYARRVGVPYAGPSVDIRGKKAVSFISWDEADAFCRDQGGRLPRENEWEYAAAGGSAKQLFSGTSDISAVTEYGNVHSDSIDVVLPVGSLLPNKFGIYDMTGNVGEWIGEYYQAYPELGEQAEIADTSLFDIRIIRGGSAWSDIALTQTYWRTGTIKDVQTSSTGFRCAKDSVTSALALR